MPGGIDAGRNIDLMLRQIEHESTFGYGFDDGFVIWCCFSDGFLEFTFLKVKLVLFHDCGTPQGIVYLFVRYAGTRVLREELHQSELFVLQWHRLTRHAVARPR